MSKRKPYEREMGPTWWMKNTFHTKYIIREGSSLVIALYSFILLLGLFRLKQGEVAFDQWLECLTHPASIILHVITLAWTLYHTVTWFSLAPKAADIWIGEKRISDDFIVKAMYAAFAVCSAVLIGLVFI